MINAYGLGLNGYWIVGIIIFAVLVLGIIRYLLYLGNENGLIPV